MSSKSKVVGTRYESKIRDTMNDWVGGGDNNSVCERVALRGSRDHGDLKIVVDDITLVGECKYSKTYPSEGELEDFKIQTVKENKHAGFDGGVLFVNLPRRSTFRDEVWMPIGTLLLLHGIDIAAIDDASPEKRKRIESLLTSVDEHSWVRLTLLDFLWTCYGAPSWGWKGSASEKV